MTTLAPDSNATGTIVLPDPPTLRPRIREDRSDLVPAWGQLAAAIVATSLIWLAAEVTVSGWFLASIPIVVIALVIFAGALLPDLIVARWEYLAEQDDEPTA